jgi:hypothetical protein
MIVYHFALLRFEVTRREYAVPIFPFPIPASENLPVNIVHPVHEYLIHSFRMDIILKREATVQDLAP